MRRKPLCSRAVFGLLAGVLVLTLAIAADLGVAALLAALGDTLGGTALRYIALGLGIVWAVVLVCLVLTLAVNSLADEEEEE